MENQNVDYSTIQHHIRRARLERSIALGNAIANFVAAAWNGLKKVNAALTEGIYSESDRRANDWRAIESDSFLKRSVPYR